VVFDSGVRSGADVLTALALGARAVAIGRPYAYGLALGGQAGIEHVLRCMLAELDLTMAIDGYPSIAALGRDALIRVRLRQVRSGQPGLLGLLRVDGGRDGRACPSLC
jgi:lactate 2-monooxygenase